MKSRGLLNVDQLDKLIPLSYAGTPTEDVHCEAAQGNFWPASKENVEHQAFERIPCRFQND